MQNHVSETKTRKDVQVVVYEDPRKRAKAKGTKMASSSEELSKPTSSTNAPKVFDMKRARHEVFKFGINGFNYVEKKEAKEALLVKLGAKPRKNMAMNYKELMAQKKLEKERREEERLRNQKGSLHIIQPKAKSSKDKVRKRQPNAVRGLDYQVGKYKDGVQFVNKKLLRK